VELTVLDFGDWARMIRNAEGSIAVTAAVSLLTILVVIGFTIDMSRAMTFKRMAQDAADSAVLACLSETTEDGSR
jgi:Flp pilus assembly protein TadG